MTSPYRPLGLFAFCTSLVSPAATVEIDWGTAAIPERLVVSDGTPFNPSNFRIELGAFEAGFTPTSANMGQWMDHWNVFDAITDPDPDPEDFAVIGVPDTGRFAGNAQLQDGQVSNSEDATPGAVFPDGTRAYIFLRNQDTLQADTEWGLYTRNATPSGDDGWVFPQVAGGQGQFNLSWTLDAANAAMVGAANDNLISGSGAYTDPSTSFALRTHQVPEPGLPILLAVSGGLILRARRRPLAFS